MDDTEAEAWQRVGEALAARFAELRITKAELQRRSGVTFKTLARYLDGEPIVRVDKRAAMAEALGWAPESIDLLLAGRDPIPAAPQGAGDLAAVEARLGQIEALLLDRLEAIHRLGERVDTLEQHLGGLVDTSSDDAQGGDPGL